jgi:hypothetical protein
LILRSEYTILGTAHLDLLPAHLQKASPSNSRGGFLFEDANLYPCIPAMASGVSDHVSKVDEIVALLG